ncbi:MAG: energy transducer TonB [Gemmatimonadales bacterium]|nr:energy transducer TonB [Gemmatimonadales bacterium]
MDAPAPQAGRGLDIAENPLVRLAERAAEADRPTLIAFDTPPVLQNVDEVRRVFERAYPRDLKDAGIGGRVELWLYIDLSGAVANHEIKTSSDSDALDRAAAEVAQQMRFRPARNKGEPAAVWISQWVTFQVI